MGHSHDKTLIASLGFSDPDKREPLHERGCQFIVAEARALIRALSPAFEKREYHTPKGTIVGEAGRVLYTPQQEWPLFKGVGQYRQTIGFLDVVIPFVDDQNFVSIENGAPFYIVKRQSGLLVVEVKINPIPISDVLRQLALYRGHLQSSKIARETSRHDSVVDDYPQPIVWVLAAPWELNDVDRESVARADVQFVRLGEKFDVFVAAQRNRLATRPPELIL